MIKRAKQDINAGEVSSLTLKFVRNRYRINANDAQRLRAALIDSGHIMEASGNRFLAA